MNHTARKHRHWIDLRSLQREVCAIVAAMPIVILVKAVREARGTSRQGAPSPALPDGDVHLNHP